MKRVTVQGDPGIRPAKPDDHTTHARPVALLILLGGLLIATGLHAEGAAPTIKVQLVSHDVSDGRPAELLVVTDSGGAEIRDAAVSLSGTDGFVLAPNPIRLGVLNGKVTSEVICRPVAGKAVGGQHAIVAALTGMIPGPPQHAVHASDSLLFEYVPEIPLNAYVVLGLLGVLIGYTLRLLLKAQAAVPAPLPAPEPGQKGAIPQAGRITRFVQDHYYVADLLLTLLLGILVLLSLAKTGRPPQSGASIAGALVLGAGLGLLTNNELLKKL